MYHLTRKKSGQYYVVLLGNNGKVLSVSETFKSKQAAWRNVFAQIGIIAYSSSGYASTPVQDDTLPDPVVYRINNSGKKYVSEAYKPCEKYIPGKNPKKKSKNVS